MALPEITALYTDYSAHTPSITSTVTNSTPDSQACVVDLIVDTGSSVILPHTNYASYFNNIVLTQPTSRLVTYSNIPALGCLSANDSLHDHTAPATFFIVEKGTPCMGRDLMSALHVRIKDNRVLPPNACSVCPVSAFSELVLQCTISEV